MHVEGVSCVEDCNHGAGGFLDDRGDLLECVFAIDAKSDECDFCASASTEWPHLSNLDVAANDLVAKPFNDGGDGCESGVSLVRDQHLQAMFGLRRHQLLPGVSRSLREV